MIKLTTEEKKKRGTLAKSRERDILSFDPLSAVPEPAFTLDEIGIQYFTRFCNILLSNKTLTIADIPIITRAAKWFVIFTIAEHEVTKVGSWQKTKTGYTQKTGAFTVMADADDRVMKIEALYGMNLTARTKINLPKTEKKNPFDEI